MKIIADLHLHSKYSRATSKDLSIENLEKYARIKGLSLLGTGDFTHPKWFSELKQLNEEDGVLKTKNGFPFIWQAEISLMYSQGGKGRRVHHVLLAPDREVVQQINEFLGKKGRLDYDGRPIFGFNSIELVENLVEISKNIEIIPAHAWTPWFSLFGSNSGFNSIKDCFKDQLKHIHAIETGLSSNPPMNWRLSELDNITLMSNSDSHSFWPWRIGREANIMELKEVTYKNILAAIRERKGFVETIEVSPLFGKYHLTGHRLCGVCLEPKESLKLRNMCPKCGRMLTVGVAQRIEELADRPEGYRPKGAIPFKSLIPLSELLAKALQSQVATKKVWGEYYKLVNHFGSEFKVLLEASKEQLLKVTNEKTAEVIILNREGKIRVKGGYDGVYGVPIIDKEDTVADNQIKPKYQQKGIDDFIKG